MEHIKAGVAQEILERVDALFEVLMQGTGIIMAAMATAIGAEDILLLALKEDRDIHKGDLMWVFGQGKAPAGATVGGDQTCPCQGGQDFGHKGAWQIA